MQDKLCHMCGETKPLDDYSKKPNGRPFTYCRHCMVERSRRWKAANEERAKANDRAAYGRLRNDPEAWAQHLSQQREDGKRRRGAKSPKGKAFTVECSRCGEAFEYVFKHRSRTVCDLCRKHDSSWTAFRLTGKQAEELRGRGRCDICGGTRPGGRFNNWHIDHDHKTGVVRGVLCAACNTAIGLLGEDYERIIAAAEYVARHQQTAVAL